MKYENLEKIVNYIQNKKHLDLKLKKILLIGMRNAVLNNTEEFCVTNFNDYYEKFKYKPATIKFLDLFEDTFSFGTRKKETFGFGSSSNSHSSFSHLYNNFGNSYKNEITSTQNPVSKTLNNPKDTETQIKEGEQLLSTYIRKTDENYNPMEETDDEIEKDKTDYENIIPLELAQDFQHDDGHIATTTMFLLCDRQKLDSFIRNAYFKKGQIYSNSQRGQSTSFSGVDPSIQDSVRRCLTRYTQFEYSQDNDTAINKKVVDEQLKEISTLLNDTTKNLMSITSENITVTEQLTKREYLFKKYGKKGLTYSAIAEKISTAIKGFNSSHMKEIPSQHKILKLEIEDVLALIWVAINDPTSILDKNNMELVNNEKNKEAIDAAIENRQYNLITALIEYQQEYSINKSACAHGTFNKIVETLNLSHKDIKVMQETVHLMDDNIRELITKYFIEKFNALDEKEKKILNIALLALYPTFKQLELKSTFIKKNKEDIISRVLKEITTQFEVKDYSQIEDVKTRIIDFINGPSMDDVGISTEYNKSINQQEEFEKNMLPSGLERQNIVSLMKQFKNFKLDTPIFFNLIKKMVKIESSTKLDKETIIKNFKQNMLLPLNDDDTATKEFLITHMVKTREQQINDYFRLAKYLQNVLGMSLYNVKNVGADLVKGFSLTTEDVIQKINEFDNPVPLNNKAQLADEILSYYSLTPIGFDPNRDQSTLFTNNGNLDAVFSTTGFVGEIFGNISARFGDNIQFVKPYKEFYIPNMPIVCPYNPNGTNDGNMLYDEGIPTFSVIARLSKGTIDNLPPSIRKLMVMNKIKLENLDINLLMQNKPWRREQLTLRVHPFVDPLAPQYGPFNKDHAQDHSVVVGITDICGNFEDKVFSNVMVRTHGDAYNDDVVFSPNNMHINGISDNYDQISDKFSSFCFNPQTGKGSFTVHWLLTAKDHVLIQKILKCNQNRGLKLTELITCFEQAGPKDLNMIRVLKNLVTGNKIDYKVIDIEQHKTFVLKETIKLKEINFNEKKIALINAVNFNQIETVLTLLEEGLSVNTIDDKSKMNLLQIAILNGSYKLAETLLLKGASLTYTRPDGKNAVILANEQDAQPVIQAINKTIKASYELLVAAVQGNLEGAKDAINRGANLNNTEESNNCTALQLSIMCDCEEIAKYLLQQNGINIHSRTLNDKKTALQLASLHKMDKIVTMISNLSQNQALLNAAASGNLVGIQQALEHGADINAIGTGGFNAIQLATLYNRSLVINFMLQNGADYTYNNNQHKQNVMQIARANKSNQIIEIISNYLKPINQQLLNAAASGNLKGLEEALGKGADINAIGDGGFIAIQLAILFGKKDVIDFMINNGADLTYNNNQHKQNAVQIASAHKHVNNDFKEIASIFEKQPTSRLVYKPF